MAIRHARVLGVPDQTEPYLVNGVSVDPADVIQPSNWDAAHDMTGVPYFVDLGVVDITDRLTSDATYVGVVQGEEYEPLVRLEVAPDPPKAQA